MDIWFLVKERSMLFTLFAVIIIINLLLLLAVWKKRAQLPKWLIIMTIFICTLLIALSIGLLVFTLFVGFNG
ncbi:hypothetical protein KP77_04470 [Jeotgalibacillus alimentarius]|uniref:Uncharacterized protein n=1 Tax=Jeotgalibacillus alimentarius TaxID=135826 RepID=A0A0C2WA69_9BACL|nr:hypothetical protein [Jeotgalibacillus alimentarius]KIL53471.1 hypothetical protein KP77_04470 [Jeotgalibacillus alimentarius]